MTDTTLKYMDYDANTSKRFRENEKVLGEKINKKKFLNDIYLSNFIN